MSESQDLAKALILTFARSTAEVFKTQVNAPATPGEMSRYDPSRFELPMDLAASVGLLSPRFNGCLTIGFPADTFLKCYNAVLGENQTSITAENRDFGSEMLNIILGMTKTQFSASHGIVIQPAIPLVVMGKGIRFSLPPEFTPFLIPFKSDMGPFYTTIALSQIAPA